MKFPKSFVPLKTSTKERSLGIAKSLVGRYWNQFSPIRNSPKSTWGLLGGHSFLGKRVKGPEWKISQSLCFLCGEGIITPEELIIALGRQPIIRDNLLEEKVTGAMRSDPSPELVNKIQSLALEIYPIAKYEKRKRFYDNHLPQDSTTPYIYVIKDIQSDIKIGVSKQPKTRFRTIEAYENTEIFEFYCSKAISNAYGIERRLLNRYGTSQNPNKKSEEWLCNVSFEQIKDNVIKEINNDNMKQK